jgi:hypothetical protein
MSFKDLGSKNIPPRVDTPEEAELRARAAARHRAKEEKAARWEQEHRGGRNEPQERGTADRREPSE